MAKKKTIEQKKVNQALAKKGAKVVSKPATDKSDKPPIKIPKSMAAVADLYYTIREQRLAAEKAIAASKAQESYLRKYMIDNIPKGEATGVAGKICRVSVVQKDAPAMGNMDVFMAHLKKHRKDSDLMSVSFSAAAVKARWDKGVEVPGIKHNYYVDLSISKV